MPDNSEATPSLGWLAGTGVILSLVACYGTLATVGLLSLLGVTLVINSTVWASAISLFALLAVVGVLVSYRRHHMVAPPVIAIIGAALIIWAMFVSFNRVIELTGFAGLLVAAIWDWRAKKCEITTR